MVHQPRALERSQQLARHTPNSVVVGLKAGIVGIEVGATEVRVVGDDRIALGRRPPVAGGDAPSTSEGRSISIIVVTAISAIIRS